MPKPVSACASLAWLKLRRSWPQRDTSDGRKYSPGIKATPAVIASGSSKRVSMRRLSVSQKNSPPAGEIAEVAAQRSFETITALAVVRSQFVQTLVVFRIIQLLQHQPLADAVAVQVGSLLEPHQ